MQGVIGRAFPERRDSRPVDDPPPPYFDPEHVQAPPELLAAYRAKAIRVSDRETERVQVGWWFRSEEREYRRGEEHAFVVRMCGQEQDVPCFAGAGRGQQVDVANCGTSEE